MIPASQQCAPHPPILSPAVLIFPWFKLKLTFAFVWGFFIHVSNTRVQFYTIERQELRQYNDVIFIDPSLRDTLFMISNRNNRRNLRYTSMSRRRHLGTNIAHDRSARFIKNRDNIDVMQAI